MIKPQFYDELSDKFELTAEGYWVSGMSLPEARRMAVASLLEAGATEHHGQLIQAARDEAQRRLG
jgi:hypothetical protein